MRDVSRFLRSRLGLGAAGLILMAWAPAALAGPAMPSNSDLLTGFGAITNGDLSVRESEGPLLIGGNFNGGQNVGFNQGPSHPAASSLSGYGALNVYGTANAYSNTNGTVHIAAPSGSGAFQNATDKTSAYGYSFPYTMSSLYSQMTSLSTGLSQLASNSSDIGNVIKAAPTTVNGVAGVAVVNITGAQLASLNTNVSGGISLNGAKLLIINVDTADGITSFNDSFNANGAGYTGDVIWNFYDATGNLNFTTEFGGTVLATGANVTASGNLDGMIVANSLNSQAELHYDGLDGTGQTLVNTIGSQPGAPNSVDPSPVPEPSSLGLLAAGLLGLTLLRRRRQL
jgi:choice-of-anchor A domain-containing protein